MFYIIFEGAVRIKVPTTRSFLEFTLTDLIKFVIESKGNLIPSGSHSEENALLEKILADFNSGGEKMIKKKYKGNSLGVYSFF